MKFNNKVFQFCTVFFLKVNTNFAAYVKYFIVVGIGCSFIKVWPCSFRTQSKLLLYVIKSANSIIKVVNFLKVLLSTLNPDNVK